MKIRLIPIDASTPGLLADDGGAFQRTFGVSIGGHAPMLREVVAQTLALLARMPRPMPWGCYLTADDSLRTLIGTCGFKHGPHEARGVEIAYFAFPEFERRGYATAMANAMIGFARHDASVRLVFAHTLPERNASCRVLEKVGMRFVGEVVDPEDGRVWRWELPIAR